MATWLDGDISHGFSVGFVISVGPTDISGKQPTTPIYHPYTRMLVILVKNYLKWWKVQLYIAGHFLELRTYNAFNIHLRPLFANLVTLIIATWLLCHLHKYYVWKHMCFSHIIYVRRWHKYIVCVTFLTTSTTSPISIELNKI